MDKNYRVETDSIGSKNNKLNFAAFFPFKLIEYTKETANEIRRHAGCMKTMENKSTNVKYKKLIMG